MPLPANRILNHLECPKLRSQSQYSGHLAQLPRRIPIAPKPFRNRAPAADSDFCIKKSSCVFSRGITKKNASPDNDLRHFAFQFLRLKIRNQYSPAILAGLPPFATCSQGFANVRFAYFRSASTRRQRPAITSRLTTRHPFDKLTAPIAGFGPAPLRGYPGAKSWQQSSYFACGDRQ
jgi:hypothetical protein